MKKVIFAFFQVLSLSFLIVHSIAQTPMIDHSTEIAAKSKLWNTSYNSRDSLSFYTLFDTAAILISAGGKWIGLEKCKELCRSLYKRRPDITWENLQEKIEVNEQWLVAYETGHWAESWTESGDTSKSVIRGKYYIMWKYADGGWHILSGIFTPLTCTGSYCNKR